MPAGRRTCYRIGGDEFVALLPETDRTGAEVVLARLSAHGAPAHTFGVAAFPDDADDPMALFAAADLRLLDARRRR